MTAREMATLSACIALLVAGCGRAPETVVPQIVSTDTKPSRVSVQRIDVVIDRLAYDGTRGVYIIKDNETGIEYIGVSGVGIAQRGAHQSGKTQVRDER